MKAARRKPSGPAPSALYPIEAARRKPSGPALTDLYPIEAARRKPSGPALTDLTAPHRPRKTRHRNARALPLSVLHVQSIPIATHSPHGNQKSPA
jgi:hypothetical protein